MPLYATATREADPADAGATGAVANTAQQVGASIGTAIFNTIAASATGAFLAAHGLGAGLVRDAAAHGYSVASGGVAAALVAAAIITIALITSRPAAKS